MLRRHASLLRNPLSLFGIVIAVFGTALGLPMMFVDLFSKHTNAYLGVVVYMVLPAVGTGGVVLAALGWILERRRRRAHPDAVATPLPPSALPHDPQQHERHPARSDERQDQVDQHAQIRIGVPAAHIGKHHRQAEGRRQAGDRDAEET